jgi:hypothetical protein
MAGRSTDVSSARDARTVTAGASALVNGTTRALYVGTGGDITVTMAAGTSVTFADVPSGVVLPIQVTHVTAVSGAADILALY